MAIELMSQHSNSLATAILVHNERLCTKMATISMAKGCMLIEEEFTPTQESITLKQRSVQLHTCARISK